MTPMKFLDKPVHHVTVKFCPPPNGTTSDMAKIVGNEIKAKFGEDVLIKSVDMKEEGPHQWSAEVHLIQMSKPIETPPGHLMYHAPLLMHSTKEVLMADVLSPMEKGFAELAPPLDSEVIKWPSPGEPLTKKDMTDIAVQVLQPHMFIMNKAELEDIKALEIPDFKVRKGTIPKSDKTIQIKYLDLISKSQLEDEDGLLTPAGMKVAEEYAKQWLEGVRDVGMEKTYPDLLGLFSDIRVDPDLARMHAEEE